MNMFAELEAALSPHAKHALETYVIAFWRDGQAMTVCEIRDAIRRLYGDAVDRELEQHMEERRQAVYPAQSPPHEKTLPLPERPTNSPYYCSRGGPGGVEGGGIFSMKTLKELCEAATPGPYFVAHDDGQKSADLLAHSGSGLAIVDTGRGGDWPIARYCEWPAAELIARCSPQTMLAVFEFIERTAKYAAPESELRKTAYDLIETLNGKSP